MSILKELLDINEKQEQLVEAAKKKAKKAPKKKAKRGGKAAAKVTLTKKDVPFMKEPKEPSYVAGNMWFDMTKSGKRAGDK